MDAVNICKHNQRGFCKFGDRCRNRHRNEICGSEYCVIENCELRHPLKCRFFILNASCKFLENCAYTHEESEEKSNVTLESEQEKTGFNCDLCDFKSSWKNGLIVHIGRKHRKIEQLDGLDTSNINEDLEDSVHLNTER